MDDAGLFMDCMEGALEPWQQMIDNVEDEEVNTESSTANRKATKKRNFTDCELDVLVTEIETRHEVLFGSLSAGNNKRKVLEWKRVTEAVNTVGVEHRTDNELKRKWSDIKVEVKKRVAAHRRSFGTTGGVGPAVAALTPFHQRVASVMGDTVLSSSSDEDSDVMLDDAIDEESRDTPPAPGEADGAGEPAASTGPASRPRTMEYGRRQAVCVLRTVLGSQRAISDAIMSTNEQLQQMTEVLTDISQSLKELVNK